MKNDYKRTDFWIDRNENNVNKYYIKIDGKKILVSQEVYSICRNSYRKIKRDDKRDSDKLYHYTNIDDFNKFFVTCDDVINKIFLKDMILLLYETINKLSDAEKYIILSIYFNKRTERELAKELNISNATLHNKKIKILKKMKEMIKQNKF